MAAKKTTARKNAATPEERQAKVTAALDTLKDGVATLVDSEGWKRFLSAQARFHQYSANNVILILMQRPDATRVAGYRTWLALGRQVRKGEKGLTILAPSRRTIEDEKTGEKKSVLTGFRTVAVFDIGQTDGEALPENPASLLEGAGDDAVHAALIEQIEAAGFRYEEVAQIEEMPGANGVTMFAERVVQVVESMTAAQKLKTTAHELAHVLLHDPADPDRGTDRGLIEVEAESTAFIVLHALGIDAGDYSFGYIAGWADGNAEKIQKVAGRVQRAAGRILEALVGPAGAEAA
jgi:antirestriction protein ArdC